MQRQVHGKMERRGNHMAVAGVGTIEQSDPMWLWADGHEVTATIETAGDKVSIVSLSVSGDVPYRSVGPEETRAGTIVIEVGAPGSKMEGSKQTFFVDDKSHERWGLIGSVPEGTGRRSVRGRLMQANMAYAARSASADFYVKDDAPIPRD